MHQKSAPWYFLLLVILAGESVFILPFVLSRVFRPTVLNAFGLDNVQLGLCFSVYGVVALVSYLFGGPLADKYPPRKLIATLDDSPGRFGLCHFPQLYSFKNIIGVLGLYDHIFILGAYDKGNPCMGR